MRAEGRKGREDASCGLQSEGPRNDQLRTLWTLFFHVFALSPSCLSAILPRAKLKLSRLDAAQGEEARARVCAPCAGVLCSCGVLVCAGACCFASHIFLSEFKV